MNNFDNIISSITEKTNELIGGITELVKEMLKGIEGKQIRFTYGIDVATKCPIRSLWANAYGKVMFTDEDDMDFNFEEADITPNEAVEIALDLTSGHYTIEDKD